MVSDRGLGRKMWHRAGVGWMASEGSSLGRGSRTGCSLRRGAGDQQ